MSWRTANKSAMLPSYSRAPQCFSLTGGITMDHLQNIDQQRRYVLLMMMSLVVIVGGLFAGLNAVLGLTGLAVAQFFLVLYTLILIPRVWSARRMLPWTLAALLPVLGIMMLALAWPDGSPSVFVWPLLVPLLAHFLLGRWPGLVVAVLALALTALIALLRFGPAAVMDYPVVVINYALIALAVLLLSHVHEQQREQAQAALLRMALSDPLTGLGNRAALVDGFERLRALAARHATSLSLLMLDVDYFKRVNDRHGHEAGDKVLAEVAELLRERLRESDFICRLGGEEFVVLLPGAVGRHAVEVAEAVRRKLADASIQHNGVPIPLTVSIGVAHYGDDGQALDDLLAAADQRLYQCKQEGRNRVSGGDIEVRPAS